MLEALASARTRITGSNDLDGAELGRVLAAFGMQAARDGIADWEAADIDEMARRLAPRLLAHLPFWIEAIGMLCFSALDRQTPDRLLNQVAAVERVAPRHPGLARLCAEVRRIFTPLATPVAALN